MDDAYSKTLWRTAVVVNVVIHRAKARHCFRGWPSAVYAAGECPFVTIITKEIFV